MAQNYFDAFIAKLQEIFMMDHAELDFGIYRIMNQKRHDIDVFLKTKLLPQVQADLAGVANSDAEADRKRMAEILAQLGTDNIETQRGNTMPLIAKLVDEYDRLKAKLDNSSDMDELQAQVFSHLLTFFSRYYDGGDFISKRRYKENTYAIPYNGEEVKLHWANSDQYYIKTAEYFRDYTFLLPTSKRKVHFILRDASTEQNNNKAQNNMERRFAIWQQEGEDDPVVEINEEGDFCIYFSYELMPKATKQDVLMKTAFDTVKPLVPENFAELLTVKQPTKKEPNRTLLEKHLADYTAKNSFDYFIHKDLGSFLRREMDFYIKNEVLRIDDLDPAYVSKQLTVVKAIKNVGEKIIRMLAQLEDFQKRLWLKKKFVLQSDYCITIDRVPESLYPDIIANDAQRKEWVRLFAIDEIQTDITTEGYSEPLTMAFLKQNPFLVLDTAFFDVPFKHKLVKSIEKIDEQTNGLLIKSDNYHALNLANKKYTNSVSAIYIDPPYNTGSDGFVYKDQYKDSSWLTMMENRLHIAKQLMNPQSSISISINENELFNSKFLLDNLFSKYLTTFSVKVRHEDRILKGDKDFHEVYESLLLYAVDEAFKPLKREKDNSSDADYLFTIETSSEPDKILTLGNKDVEVYEPGHYKIVKHQEPSFNYTKPISVRGSIREGNSSGRFYVAYLENLANLYPGYIFKVPNMGDDNFGYRFFWTPSIESGRKNGDYYQGAPRDRKDTIEIPYPNYVDFEKAFNDATDEGGMPFRNGKKPIKFLQHILALQNISKEKNALIMDFFAGSASTGHAVIEMNKDQGNRKYLLSQVGDIFDDVTKPRMEKVVYSDSWKNGKPVSRQGVSQCFKYIRLEQYEDTLNNLQLKEQQASMGDGPFAESYMLGYWLDTETRDSLLNLKWFENPFAMTLKATRDNELVETPVDMVETFNFLIGLEVETESWYKDDNICVLTGRTHRDGLKTLVIWRNCKVIDNKDLNDFFDRMDFRTRDSEFDLIYVNGDNTLPNLRRDEEHWKVVLIEEEFQKRMFTED
ncbi:MAG: site-specific DNA-methyltransferase [Bacteroidaceae bacterium]|nr:site-specific DNA-methyltransferase [Bacteroidaceae bacterium]